MSATVAAPTFTVEVLGPDPSNEVPLTLHRLIATSSQQKWDLRVVIERGIMSDGSPDVHWLAFERTSGAWTESIRADVITPAEFVLVHELLGAAIAEARKRGMLPADVTPGQHLDQEDQ